MRSAERAFAGVLDRLFAPLIDACMAVALAMSTIAAVFVLIVIFWKIFLALLLVGLIIAIPVWRYWDRNIRW